MKLRGSFEVWKFDATVKNWILCSRNCYISIYFFILFRISSNSFLLNRSWIENIRSTAEAAGEATTQQEEVACHVVPTTHSEGLQLLLLWLTWLTLLCSKPNIPPHQATTMPSASSVSSSSGLCWPEVCRRVRKSTLAYWVHDPVRECSSKERETTMMYYTWKRKNYLIDAEHKHIQSSFSFYHTRTLPLVRLKEKVESS